MNGYGMFDPTVLDPREQETRDDLSRREFLRVAATGLAFGSLAGCVEPPRELILPYTVQPAGVLPGKPRYFATTMTLGGYGTGLLVESHEGRPTKVEGNPDHPASLGAAGVYEQASVLQLYDPFRAKSLRYGAAPASWNQLVREFGPTAEQTAYRGSGLRFLLEPTASPLTAELLVRIRERYPESRVYSYAPLNCNTGFAALRTLFGRPLQPQYDLRNADVILTLDANVLGAMPFHLRYARQFADGRRVTSPNAPMNRLYAVESALSDTGGSADHRYAVKSSDIGVLTCALLREIVAGLGERATTLGDGAALGEPLRAAFDRLAPLTPAPAWTRAVAQDLLAHAGRSVVIAGDQQPAAVHVLAHTINTLLGNVGRTVWYTAPVLYDAGGAGIDGLVEEARAGAVDSLIILGGNPVYNSPAGLEFRRALRAIRASVYCGLYENETARACHWFVPTLHYLESWGDARAYDGTASIVQPLIAPLYDGRTIDQVLSVFVGQGDHSAHDLLRESWRARSNAAEFDRSWAEVLQHGVIPNTAAPSERTAIDWSAAAQAFASVPPQTEHIELVFQQDAKVYDGCFANNPWLQELPDPATKLTWDNAALLSARTAEQIGLKSGDLIRINVQNRSITIPALVSPIHADDSVSVCFGYGRTGAEAIARGVGRNVFTIWPDADVFTVRDAAFTRIAGKGDGTAELATTQNHWSLNGRPHVLHATLEDWREDPDFAREARGRTLSLYQPYPAPGEQWAMTIDLGVCTGCSACVIACQAENNIPVVGKTEVLNSREMHWLRIDRYFTEAVGSGTVVQPMLCQHCEKAPCEYVCPVNATVHSPDGLNEMVYNRCVGTRFCSNNCPYKVRRFNWYNYNVNWSETELMQFNPDVTVRARGVMEKCTYCVQRIREAEIQASLEHRRIRDGEVVTACQQACPTRAIVFGSLTDADSAVARTQQQSRSYSVLHELGTQPRTRYLARINNPGPGLRGG